MNGLGQEASFKLLECLLMYVIHKSFELFIKFSGQPFFKKICFKQIQCVIQFKLSMIRSIYKQVSVNSTKLIGRCQKAVRKCINSTKGRFIVDRSDICFIFMNNLHIKRRQSVLLFIFLIVNDMLACQPFRKFWKASKCSREVNKTKISSIYQQQ